MKVLIAGGTGAMGAYLVKILAELGADVDVTTRQKKAQDKANVKFILGDFHDDTFMRRVLASGYDVIIDFMTYSTGEFKARSEFLARNTGHYIFLSSSRVYADSEAPIQRRLTEDSPRLLDVSTDKNYLATDEYALAKARQEDILRNGRAGNYTIIRPYITYSNERLQLGVYEKERWLYRTLHGRDVVFSEDIAAKFTTMTWGHDVAFAIAGIAGKPETFGEAYHITGRESMRWRDIAGIYGEVLESLGFEMRIKFVPRSLDDTAQVKYDRLYNRIFDNSKISQAVPKFKPVSIREGLSECLSEFVKDNHQFRAIDFGSEGRMDRLTGKFTPLNEIPGLKPKVKYFVLSHFPSANRVFKLYRKIFRRH